MKMTSPRVQTFLLGVLVALLAQYVAPVDALARAAESERWRMVTGIVALALLAAQFLLGVRKRLVRLPGGVDAWRGVHKLTALAFVASVVLHTGAAWGTNLTGALLAVLTTLVLAAQAGHVMKTSVAARAAAGDARATALDREVNAEQGRIHRLGLSLHLLLAGVLVPLAIVHVFSVWYY